MKNSFGVLLVHLGTPAAPTEVAVEQFLKEFLSDPFVIPIPKVLWRPILKGFVLRTRPRKVAKLYQTIWWKEGSPLQVIAKRQQSELEKVLAKDQGVFVQIAMRYGTPSIKEALHILRNQAVTSLVVFPLFPQYSTTTTASIFDRVNQEISNWSMPPFVYWITDYHDEPSYIEALANSVRHYWWQEGRGDRLLISFHGIPKRCHRRGDPYFWQCQQAVTLLVQALKLKPDEWAVAFQSRFGSLGWLGPRTQETLVRWAQEGISRVEVLTPGFSADCLETLEEIAVRGKKAFLTAGGKELHVIPALNDSHWHITMMKNIILKTIY